MYLEENNRGPKFTRHYKKGFIFVIGFLVWGEVAPHYVFRLSVCWTECWFTGVCLYIQPKQGFLKLSNPILFVFISD